MDTPTWLVNALVIGDDELGATLAVGTSDGIPWTARKWQAGPWLSYRPASRSEIARYDAIVLHEMRISMEDNSHER